MGGSAIRRRSRPVAPRGGHVDINGQVALKKVGMIHSGPAATDPDEGSNPRLGHMTQGQAISANQIGNGIDDVNLSLVVDRG